MRPAEPVELRIRARTIWMVALNVLGLVAAVTVLRRVSFVVTWVLVALVLALALDPAVSWLERKKVRRGFGVVLVAVGLLAFLGGVGATVAPMALDQGRALAEKAPELVDKLQRNEGLAALDARFDILERAKSEVGSGAKLAAGSLFAVVGSVAYGVTGTVTVFVLTIFMLLYGRPLVGSALEWVSPDRRPRLLELGRRTRKSVGGYVAGSLIIASIGGVVSGVTLLVLGVPYFLPLALLMIVLGIIPYIGPLLGGALIVGTTFLSSGVRSGVIALVVFVAYQQLENEILQPLVQRKTIRMNPLIIALVMLAGTAYAGIVGALLALPVAGAVQVVLQDVLERRKARYGDANGDEQPGASAEPPDRSRPMRPATT